MVSNRIRRLSFAIAVSTVLPGSTMLAETSALAADGKTQLACNLGPIEKTYGGAPWHVYSCNDGKSIIFVADTGAAAPFVFSFISAGDGYHLNGEGTGDRKATDAAFADLQKLTGNDIQRLLQETKAVKPRN